MCVQWLVHVLGHGLCVVPVWWCCGCRAQAQARHTVPPFAWSLRVLCAGSTAVEGPALANAGGGSSNGGTSSYLAAVRAAAAEAKAREGSHPKTEMEVGG